jgi:hypothetical protein
MENGFRIPWTAELAHELACVQSRFGEYLDTLPTNVRPLVIEMAPVDAQVSPGRFSVLALPFWLGAAFQLDLETQRQLALANIFALFHFIAQDNLADESLDETARLGMVLSGTLYLQQMLAIYQRYFPPGSPFWPLMAQYWREWAGSLAWERQRGLRPSFSNDDLLKAARKAAPLKICTSGLALLGNRPDLISSLERAVDQMHMVMQMADDLADLEEDLAGSRYNAILSLMAARGVLAVDPGQDIKTVGQALFRTCQETEFFQRMHQVAEDTRLLLESLGFPEWGALVLLLVQQAEALLDGHLQAILPEQLGALFSPASHPVFEPFPLVSDDARRAGR